MKLYKTSIVSLPITSCEQCPNRVARRCNHGSKSYSEWVCGAITYNTTCPISQEIIPRHRFPSLTEAMACKGWHPECPLEDYTPKAKEGAR